MKIGIDIGYHAVKVFSDSHKLISFPSVVGTADISRFTAGGVSPTHSQLIQLGDKTSWMFGNEASEMSRMIFRNEEREWYKTIEYEVLLTAALREAMRYVSIGENEKAQVVTGLPVMFYDDRKQLQDIFVGGHSFFWEDGREGFINVSDCRIIPQPFGTLLGQALDMDGDIQDIELARGMIGVIDCGGKTTNILTSSKMREVARLTTSVNIGGWDIARSVREKLNAELPYLDNLRDSAIVDAIVSRSIKAYGRTIALGDLIDSVTRPFAESIMATATQLWNSGASIDQILLTGGASIFIERFIKERYPHTISVSDPISYNVIGYYKFAKRIFKEKA